MYEYIFESPLELVKHLFSTENINDGIFSKPSAICGWYIKAKKIYDPSACDCTEKATKEEIEQVESMYKTILTYSDEEKRNALFVIGGDFTLKLNGQILGKVSFCE